MIVDDLDKLAVLLGEIQYNGYTVCSADATDRNGVPYSYTVGLASFNHPELIITGLPAKTAKKVLKRAASHVVFGKDDLQVGETLVGISDTYTFRIIEVDEQYYQLLKMFPVLLGDEILGRCLQVVYSDDAGKYPWDEGSRSANIQRVLGECCLDDNRIMLRLGWVID